MKNKARAITRNPIIIVVPLVSLLLLGWNVYVNALNKPNQADNNLLHNGGFEHFDANGNPREWTLAATPSLESKVSRTSGFDGGTALGIRVERYDKGSLDLKSSTVPVNSGAAYLYKGYYRSDIGFSLLVKYYYKDGTSSLQLMRNYAASKTDWTTASTAFRTDDRVDRVQIVYRLSQKGMAQFDRSYIEKRDTGAYVPGDPGAMQPNLIDNGDLEQQSDGAPVAWSPFTTGNNTTEPTYVNEDGSAYLRTVVDNYKDGQAKWDHQPVIVEYGRYTQFSVDYRSDVPAKIVAEYALDDRTRVFVPISELTPAGSWTKIRAYTEAPPRAVEVSVHVVLGQNGTLETDNYALRDLTKQDTRHFNRALVSVTFDDGWDSSYVTAARILGYLNYKGTFYINPDAIDKPSFLTSEQLDNLEGSGHQLASQAYEYLDLTTLNARQLDRQLRLGKEYFTREYHMTGIDFAPSNGRYDAEVQATAREYYRSSRSTEEGLNTRQNIDVYNLKTLYVDKNMAPERFKAALEEARQKAGWLILVYHRVEDNHPHRTTVSAKSFAEQMELIRESGLTVKTVEGALDEIWGQ